MKINCAIIDEKIEAVNVLKTYVEQIPYLNLIGGYTSAVDALNAFKHNAIDLVFIGIKMQQLSGLEFAKILPKKTKIVFVTAFSEYAIDGYKSGGFDYLLKPVSFENFQACVERVRSYMCDVDEGDPIRRDGYFFVKSDYKQIRICINEILFIEGMKDYVRFHLKDKPNVLALSSMKELEEHLPKRKFMRVHRSFIANMDLFDYTDKARLYYGDMGVPISESYRNQLQDFLDKHTL